MEHDIDVFRITPTNEKFYHTLLNEENHPFLEEFAQTVVPGYFTKNKEIVISGPSNDAKRNYLAYTSRAISQENNGQQSLVSGLIYSIL